jgi:hypothetical protein
VTRLHIGRKEVGSRESVEIRIKQTSKELGETM